MKLELTQEQAMVQQTAREFALREVEPRAKDHDRHGTWPGELVKRLGELGLMGVAIDERYGGAGFDTIAYALAMEEISRACASLAVIMSVNNSLCCDSIKRWGSDEQKERFLRPMASGEQLGCSV